MPVAAVEGVLKKDPSLLRLIRYPGKVESGEIRFSRLRAGTCEICLVDDQGTVIMSYGQFVLRAGEVTRVP